MNKLFLTLISALWMSTQVVSGQEIQSYSLQECIDYALENNPNLKIAELEKVKSKASVGEVRSEGLPQVTGDVGFTNNLSIQTSFIGDFISPVTYSVLLQEGLIEQAPNLDTRPIAAAFGTDYTANAGISVSQLIFDGAYFIGLKAASTYQEVAQKEEIKTKIDIVEAVEKAFYGVLINQENLELLTTNYQRLDSLLNETRTLYENGFAEKIDVNRVTIEHNNIRDALSTLTESLVTTVAFLKFQMGMPVNQSMTLSGNLDDIALQPIQSDLTNFDYSNRIEYEILDVNRALVDLDTKRYRVQYIPNIKARFNAGYNSGANSFGDLTEFGNDEVWFDYSSWGFSMNIPIFDGLRKSYIIQQKRVDAQQLEQNQAILENSIDLEIVQARINLNNNIARLNTLEENRELAKEVFEITRLKYQEGIGTNLEVIEADAAYKTAQFDYSSALYDALVAQIDLRKALGILMN